MFVIKAAAAQANETFGEEISIIEKNNMTGIPSASRIVKPIRGGGGKRMQTPRGLTSSQVVLIESILHQKK